MLGAVKKYLLWTATAIVLVPVQARADGYVTPWIGLDLASSPEWKTAYGTPLA